MILFADVYYALIAAAVIPAVALMIYVYRSDKLESEPPGLLIRLVLYGIIATALATVTETIGSRLLAANFSENSFAYNFLLYFVVVACSEEGFKYLLLKNRTWNHPAFNCLFDGVVYAVFVSLGFALWENINYVLQYGFGTALVRAVTAVPGHACFGVFMGVWYGFAKKYADYGRPAKAAWCRFMAFFVPALLHGSYDYVASMQTSYQTWIFIVFLAAMFFVAFRLVRKISSNDTYI